MSCIQYGFTIQGDVDGKLAASVDFVAGHDYTKAQVLAGYFGTEDFLQYIKQETGLDDYLSVNANTMRKLLGSFFVSRHSSINNTINKKNANTLNGFSSAKAKAIATDHTANLIIESYYSEINKPKTERLNRLDIIKNVSKVVNTIFNNNIVLPLIDKLKADNIKDNSFVTIDNLNDQINDLFDSYDDTFDLLDEATTQETVDALNAQLDELDEQINVAESERYALYKNIVTKHGNVREKNYSNLNSRIRGNPNEWYSKAFNSSKLINLIDEFSVTLESDKLIERNYADENDVVNVNSDSVDEMAKSWEDSLYGSFDRHVNAGLKFYLNRLYNLASPVSIGNTEYQFDTNNELGVPMTMGANFIIAQISNYGTFYSVDEFINSISNASKTNASLYGLGKMVNDMSINREFANKIFSQLNNPKISKSIVTVAEDGPKFDISNKSANHNSHMIYELINSIKGTYNTKFDINDKSIIKDALVSLNQVADNNVFAQGLNIEGSRINLLNNTIDTFLSKYFPKIDLKGVHKYLRSSADLKTNYAQLLGNISELNNNIERLVDDYNISMTNHLDTYKVWAKKRTAAEDSEIPFNTPAPTFDYSSVDFSKINTPIIDLTKKLINYTVVKNDLNSVNAEGNMASDLIGNSYITNFVKQIMYGNAEQSEAGLEHLKDFITKSPQYQYSPFYFGVKDVNGNVIQQGLFYRDRSGKVTVNPNAKSFISIDLFDGIKDRTNAKATMYSGMSKGDYFLTQLLAFKNPAKDITRNSNILTAGYFFRTPSDAPKNFIIQAPKYAIDGLWNVIPASRSNYVNEIQSELARKYTFTSTGEFEDASGDILLGTTKGNTKNNIKTADEIYDMLKNPIDNKAYNNLFHIYDNDTNKVSIPMIYIKGESPMIVWLQGDKVIGTNSNIAENIEIKEVFNGDLSNTNPLSYDFLIDVADTITNDGINEGKIQRVVDKNNVAFRALQSHVIGEVNNFVNNLNNVFEKKAGRWVTKSNVNNLIDRAHYNGGSIVENGKLTGNFFKFIRLFETNGFNAGADLENALFLYGGVNEDGMGGLISKDKGGKLVLNPNRADLININNNRIELSISEDNIDSINNIVENWLNNYYKEVVDKTAQYSNIIGEDFSNNDIVDYAVNNAIMEMNFDDVFEGDTKFYKNSQDFLKRAKEIQAAGKAYAGSNFNEPIGGSIRNTKDSKGAEIPILINGNPYIKPTKTSTGIVDLPMNERNGFRGVTINNTLRPSERAGNIKKELIDILTPKVGKKEAENIATEISAGYYANTSTNDAQSFITLDEFISRRHADGTLNEYQGLLEQLLDDSITIQDVDLKGINARIQVQKNFYFDKQFDENTGTFYPRQIKNAEFVLIPKLIKGTDLEVLHDIMKANDIGQVNTVDASKAAKKNILTFWDNKGVTNSEAFTEAVKANNGIAVEDYYYQYLYKQQDVADHMVDEKNKAGIQVMKKLIDNSSPEVQPYINTFFKNYVANIKDSFNTMIDNMGWKVGTDGALSNADGRLNADGKPALQFEDFYKKARIEAQRLGMDSNFIEYLTPDVFGQPPMPNYMNNVSSKLESIAQSMFNNGVTRQTLPGWHAAQVTSVGHGVGVLGEDGVFKNLKYHPEVTDENGNVTQESYAEVMLPRWSNLIPKDYDLDRLGVEGLDIHLGYRIPTEGKQSVSILKVVGFLDSIYGSTVMVPDEWVTQTGSDFDVDSIYAISYEMYKDSEGTLKKVQFDNDTSEEGVARRYDTYVKQLVKQRKDTNVVYDEFNVEKDPNTNIIKLKEFATWSIEEQNSRRARNNQILDSMIDIMKHDNSREENYSRSNFDDLTAGMKKMDNLRGASSIVRSTYNPLDQIDFMENAMSGATLKAFSVTRDTFNSVNNYAKSTLGEGHEIVVEYDLNEYNIDRIKAAYDNVKEDKTRNVAIVTHNRIANSNNNRNVVGKILTVYSSQTTAHILDAVKEGTIFNENDYTFGTFKTLIDVGIDYDTAIAFLMQPGVTNIVDAYFQTKSIYINNSSNAINTAVKSIATDLGVTVGGKAITEYTNINTVFDILSNDRNIQNAYRELFNTPLSKAKGINTVIPSLNGSMLQRRLKGVEISNNAELSQEDKVYRDAAFDLAMVMSFNKYRNTSRNIESLARVSNPDRFGAKQTVRGTRVTLENILKYTSDPDDKVGSTILVNGERLTQALYPNITSAEGIDVEASAYPYLAAFLKYATQPSVEANSQLFPTESKSFNDITDTVQARLNINFTDEQYREFKQYMMSNVYSGVHFLNTPTTLNEYGLITLDNSAIEDQTERNTFYWNEERARIFGYDVTQSSSIEIVDINNPTEEEISNFNKLTPAQKVIFVQSNFNDGRGVFDFLDVNLFNQYEFKQKGFTSQSIKFSDQLDNIEEVYIAFSDSFFNKNLLVRLASVDLVKYAFIVEGFKFKKGGISKIITNDALYTNLEDKGMNVIEAVQQQFMVYNNPYENATKSFIDKFVRSHSEIVKEVSIPKAKQDRQGNENIGRKFARHVIGEGVLHIPFNEANKDILEHLTIAEDNPRDYIRVKKYINDTQRKTTLYKVKVNNKGVYLYPLNLLERNETSEYSANPRNNIHKAANYYEALVDMSIDNGTSINELVKDENALNQINILKDQFTIKAHKSKHVVETIENRNEIIRLLNNGNSIQQAEVDKFVNDVLDYVNSPVEEALSYGVVRNDNRFINSIIPAGTSVIQNLPIGEDVVTVKITKYGKSNGLSKQFNYVLREDQRADITKVKPEELNALNNAIAAKSKFPTLYKIELVTSEQEREDYERLKQELEDDAASQMNAVTNLIGDFDVDVAFNYTDNDKVARDIFNELNKRALSNGDKRARKFKRGMDMLGVDRTSDVSVHDNKRNIYVAASNYYSQRSHELLSNIDTFTGINGEEFSIDDPNLYKHLTEHPEDYTILLKLILDAKTFGEQFYDIFNLNLVGEDEATTKAINKIRDSINNVRTSSKLSNAVNLLFNDYIANNFSTNPIVRNGLIELKTTFGDTDWFDLTFSDVGEINHKQIQTVVKYVNLILNEATKIIAPKSIAKFNNQYENIMKANGDFDMNNIVTKEGKFITPYTDKFLEDREKVISDFRIAKENYDNDPIGYYKAKLVRDKWRAKNIQQEIVSPYYNANNALVDNVLKNAPKEYIKYMELTNELYNNPKGNSGTNKEERDRRRELSAKIRNITADTNENGELKSDEQMFRAARLKEYIKAKKELNAEYFNHDESEGFKETLEYYTNIIKQYEKKHSLETLDQKLNNRDYREAYEWVQGNAIYTLNAEAQKTISEAFAALKSSDNNSSIEVKKLLKDADAYDEFGNIDARKLNAEQLAKLKKLTEHKFSWTYDSNAGEAILIKDVPSGLPVLKDSFYRMLRADGESASEVNIQRLNVIGEINKLLGKGLNKDNGKIDAKDLFDKLTNDELNDLGNYYLALHNIKGNRNNKELAKKFKANVEFVPNMEGFNAAWSYAQSNLKGTKQYDTWLNIFVQRDKDGGYVTDDDGKFLPNDNLFGYILPKDKTYIDEKKTAARNTIEQDIEYVPNEYYYAAQREASNNGTFNEWYNTNHVFNPYTHRMEPLKVWTTMQVNPNGKLNGSYSYAPTYENTERTVKEEYENANHKQYSTNYNVESGDYNNLAKLSTREKDMLDLLQSTINAHASTHSMRTFAEQGFLPRRARHTPDANWYIGQVIGSMGLEFRNTGEQQWTDKIDYTNDFDTDFDMMSLIKQKGYKERIKVEARGTRESDEDYAKRVADINDANKAIDAANLKLDNELLDNDWKSVFNDFIDKATEYNGKQRVKNTVYLLLEDLKDSPAYQESSFGRNLKRDGARSSIERDAYKTTAQTNSHDLVQNWTRRILFDQFKKGSPYSKYADLAQNITSAKYMIANVTGGIANVGTGMTNVFGEMFASDYFGKEAFTKGQSQYFSNSLSFIADMYKETTNNPVVGLTKLFDVVDYDAFTERRPNEKATERVKRIRGSLYSMQSGGEHYMQNSVLFAVLKSHRIFKDNDGQVRAGSIANFNWKLEVDTLMGMLNGKEDLLIRYKSFLKDIKSDLNELRKYDSFTKDFNEEFLRDLGDKTLIKEYIAERSKALAKSEEEFAKNPLVEDQFELIDGYTVLKPDSQMTGQMFGELRQKVISINKKIHGVYDKIGAASIEKEWWGGLVMQYHKHIYPGIMKRYRRKGYYNESRGSMEKGSYVSLADYLAVEFKGITKRIKGRTETDNENVALASFQEIIKASIDTVTNFKMNYQLMPVWEQNNMRRALGDLLGITGAFMTAIAIHLMTDDDEIKESELLSTALYMADRLNSESAMYTPWGLFAEAGTLWSSPLAAQNGPKDLIKGLGVATGMLFDEEYNPNYTTGLYKGQNKLAVLAYRNTPIYRVYQRLSTMTKNNNYYKINENALNIKFAKGIADDINPD